MSLICADCIGPDGISNIEENTIDLIIADPPYNVSQSKSFRNADGTVGFRGWKPIEEKEWDAMNPREYRKFTLLWLQECYRVLNTRGTIYVWIGAGQLPYAGMAMQRIGYTILNIIAWHKPNAFPYNYGKTRYSPSIEWIIFARKGKAHHFYYTEFQRDMWAHNTVPKAQRIHPAQKPEELIKRMVLNSSKIYDSVLDPFAGSGVVGAVCKKLGRRYTGYERDIDYYDKAKKKIGSCGESE